MSTRISLAPMVLCECRSGNFGGLDAFNDYLFDRPVICSSPNCKRELDYKTDARRIAKGSPHALVGGREGVTGESGEYLPGHLHTTTLPADFTLLDDTKYRALTFSWKPESAWVVDSMGSLPARLSTDKVVLRCIAPTRTLQYQCIRVPLHTPPDQSWNQLLNAIDAFLHEDYETMVFSANVAVESMLAQANSEFLGKRFKAKHVKRILGKNGYCDQLSDLMPIYAETASAPKLPKWIKSSLQTILEYRNYIGHKGHLDKEIEKDDAADLLADAALGFYYMKILKLYFSGEAPRCFD